MLKTVRIGIIEIKHEKTQDSETFDLHESSVLPCVRNDRLKSTLYRWLWSMICMKYIQVFKFSFCIFFLQNSYETRQEWSFTYHRDLSFTNFTCIAVGYRNQTVSKTMQFGDIYCKCPIIDSEHYSNFCALIS